MRTFTNFARWAGMIGLAASLGCKSLDVENPNAPDAKRAFADPGAVAGLVTGAFKGWWNSHSEYNSALLLNTMGDGLTASWNNFNIRYYASEGNECAQRCGWNNNPSSAFRFQVETYWYGNYAALSNANDVLTAIRKNNVVITSPAFTKALEAAAVTIQGLVFHEIAMNYDQGFIVTEATDLSTPDKVQALNFSPRAAMRDAAIAKLGEAITLWGSVTSALPKEWFGSVNQPTYTTADMIRMAKTAQAMTLAFYPRTLAENGAVNWGQVATYASAGISAGGTDVGYYDDRTNFYDGNKEWGADPTTVRVDNRVARLITDGPQGEAKRAKFPWPDPAGNPQPNAFDKRVGDGSYGSDADFLGVGTVVFTGNEGTDFLYASKAQFRPARGQYHQSNLGYRRYSYLAYPGYGLPGEDGKGFAPQFTKTLNDLLWAEGLLRSGGSKTQVATLINKTRVTRGGLSALTGGESDAVLEAALQYEQDTELLGTSSSIFYNRRRRAPFVWTAPGAGTPADGSGGLIPGTPRHMPVPAKELQVLQKELYTFGGPGQPDAAPGVDSDGRQIRNVRAIWEEISTASRMEARRRSRH